MDEAILREEQSYLDRASDAIRGEMTEIDQMFDQGILAADDAAEESVRQMLETRYRTLLLANKTPYFARIDFTPQGKRQDKIYLGKTTVYGQDRDMLVTDWRSPVSNLYYECRLGQASYICPEGEIAGELELKRQIEIETGKVKRYDDVDITSADELLTPYLTVSADARLKNIIATIQSEQNGIIRADIKRPLIVQGVAGSGKTTVALHRIAYLVYTYAQSFKPEHFLIISSGGFFLSYIAGVLPDLGVENVPQITFEDLSMEFSGLKARVVDPSERMFSYSDNPAATHNSLYKTSWDIYSDMDKFIMSIAPRFCPKNDFIVAGECVVQRVEIEKMLTDQSEKLPLFERLELVKNRLNNIAYGSRENKAAIRAYFSSVKPPRTAALYEEFLAWLPEGKLLPETIKPGWITYEDLAPMLYLRYRVAGASNPRVRHIVIDEAQDFAPTQLWLLQKVYPKASFTVLGDLAQGIYPNRNVVSWQKTNLEIWDGAGIIANLRKSYRTTIEIMEAANIVLRNLEKLENTELPEGEAVVRHGEEVRLIDVWGRDERVEKCAGVVRERLSQGHKNIAVIMHGAGECHGFAKELLSAGIAAHVITARDGVYEGGVCVLPCALSKGLEFDAVTVADAERYTATALNAHLLYVAMTRAMHTLDIIYEGEKPSLLEI